MDNTARVLQQQIDGSRLIAFDFDGTLVDLEGVNYGALQKLARKYLGYTVELEDYRNYAAGTRSSVGIQNSFERLAEIHDFELEQFNYKQLQQEYRQYKREYLSKEPLKYAKLIDGAKPFLELLQSQDKHIAIGSASSREFIEKLLRLFEIYDYFELIVPTEDVTLSKPDPETYDLVVEHFRIPRAEVTSFEDSKNGLRSAKAAGLFVIGIHNEGWNDDFVHTLSDIVVDDYNEVLRLIV